ncbi:MAG: hypothetical protein IKZ43_02700 [Acidaminococcaceae bacterium]|nr:hypothetical protein [Acidaminococcaceae bacterium]
MMWKTLNPEYRFSSLKKITPEWMGRHRYRVLLLDIDNTLLSRNSSEIPGQHLDWLQKLEGQGIVILLASNNGGKRTEVIARQLAGKGLCIPLLTWAGKPLPWAYTGVLRLLKESFPEVADEVTKGSSGILAAGDQVFTDVIGAHWHNLPAALLRPLSQNDFIGTKLLRILETWVMLSLEKRNMLPKEDAEI